MEKKKRKKSSVAMMMMAITATSVGGLERTSAMMMVNPELAQKLCRGNVSKVHTLQEVLQRLRRQCTYSPGTVFTGKFVLCSKECCIFLPRMLLRTFQGKPIFLGWSHVWLYQWVRYRWTVKQQK